MLAHPIRRVGHEPMQFMRLAAEGLDHTRGIQDFLGTAHRGAFRRFDFALHVACSRRPQ